MSDLTDIVSEERLLGILLNDPAKLGDARITANLFASGLYREALQTAMNLRFRGQGVDSVSMGLESKNAEVGELCAKLQARNDMGAGYAQLVAALEEQSLRRRAAAVCKAGYEACYDMENDFGPVVDGLERDVLGIRQGTDDGMEDGSDQRDVMDELRWRMENPGGVRGTRFGFPILEGILDGLHGGQLYVIGARPSVGKTALMTTMILNLLEQSKCPAVFSLEMKGVLLKSRILSSKAGVAVAKKEGHTDTDVDRLNDAITWLQGRKWFYKDNARMDIDKIVSLCRRLRTSEKLDAVFVDYLQIIQNSRYKGADVRNRVAENCFMLKQLGEELDVPVVVPAQLRRKEGFFNRATKATERTKPELEDLKECGDIEQDADVVMLLDRDQVGNSKYAELRVAKQRNGPVGTIAMEYNPSTSLFKEDEEATQWV